MPELELTGEHVANLGDEDLRSLVIKLCEAELRRMGRPSSAVLAGGNQTSPDGGMDVRIHFSASAGNKVVSASNALVAGATEAVGRPIAKNPGFESSNFKFDFIPNANTGFQVKCENMPASAIASEMRPKGVLRDSIKELIACRGAYIIVSSKGTVADLFLGKRLQSMRDAVADQPDHLGLKLDFYDRDRLARWVREYPGVEMWLRDRVNARLQGWQGYGHWTSAEVTYLLDDTARLVERTGGGAAKALSAAEGLGRLRTALRKPGQVLRLVGLSGTGKTRFVQALFEKDVGNDEPLDQSSVLYTDLGNEPEPSAREMLIRLGAIEQRAIIIVDNCNPKTHRTLADVVSQHKSVLSLLTVEYDVADDDTPDSTDIYELAPASDQVLERILQRLAPHVTDPDRHRITEFSGGNARVALALARTVEKGETLGVLNDSELFRRLFRQGQAEDPQLLRAAQVCSLVYSFEGLDTKTDSSELKVLARLAEMTPTELYRHIGNLMRRDLVQGRSKWRAVLPPALANRLAKLALQDIPAADITDAFEENERLLISFSRRLEYLHDSEEACAIARRWMDDEKWLANPALLNDLGRKLVINLAPLVPEKVLASMEQVLSDKSAAADFVLRHKYSMSQWSTLLRHLAYQPVLFDKAACLLLILAEHEEEKSVNCHEAWKEIFHIGLSGTLAPPEQRVQLLENLLATSTDKRLQLIWVAVEAMLEANHISSSHNFSFGARPQSYGWEPKRQTEVVAWFESAFALIRRISSSGHVGLQRARTALAARFRELWSCGVEEQLTALMLELAGSSGGWPAGWVATKTALRFDRDELDPESVKALQALNSEMAPKGFVQEVRAYALGHAGGFLDIADALDDSDEAEEKNPVNAWERVDEKVVALGTVLAADEDTLEHLLPELLSENNGRQYFLGQGLVKASADEHHHWKMLKDAFLQLPGESNISFLAGFIHGLKIKSVESASLILDGLVGTAKLDQHYPALLGMPQDDREGGMLIDSMRRAVAKPHQYHLRIRFGTTGGLSIAKFCEAVEMLSQMEDGLMAAIEQLSVELYLWKNRKLEIPAELIFLARRLLPHFNFDARSQRVAWRINELVKLAFMGSDSADAAAQFTARFVEALEDYLNHSDDYGDVACTLFKLQPLVALNAFLGKNNPKAHLRFRARFISRHGAVVQCAPEDVLLQWVKEAPEVRAALVASEITIFQKKKESTSLLDDSTSAMTLSPLAVQLLELSSDKVAVLNGFNKHLHPSHWIGSLGQTLAPYMELVENLSKHEDTVIADWAHKALSAMHQRIDNDRGRDVIDEQSFE